MTFEPGTEPVPESLRDAVQRVDFTATELRFWVEGTIDPTSPASAPAFVSQGTGQRFVLERGPDVPSQRAFEAFADVEGLVTVWGVVEAPGEGGDIVLRVEGYEVQRR